MNDGHAVAAQLASQSPKAVLARDSEFWEKCARHKNRQTARAIQSLYLCDDCVVRLTREALNGRSQIYNGETVTGFCGLCNETKQCTMRSFFMCPFCWNVIVAYQKSIAASKAVHAYWKKELRKKFPQWQLTETEEVYLSPYVMGGKTKKQAASDLHDLDFIVSETETGKPLFHIELKAGPGSIEELSEFQLDINDSNDIIGAVLNTSLPAYIFHVQLAFEYALPTRGTVAVGMWWTDIFRLMEHRLDVRTRRDERKPAGYYDPAAFNPINSFPDALESGNYKKLAAKLKQTTLSIE